MKAKDGDHRKSTNHKHIRITHKEHGNLDGLEYIYIYNMYTYTCTCMYMSNHSMAVQLVRAFRTHNTNQDRATKVHCNLIKMPNSNLALSTCLGCTMNVNGSLQEMLRKATEKQSNAIKLI